MIEVNTLDGIDEELRKINPGTLVAINGNIGFYISHQIAVNKNIRPLGKSPYAHLERLITINPTPDPIVMGNLHPYHKFYRIAFDKEIFGIEQRKLQEIISGSEYVTERGHSVLQVGHDWPPECALILLEEETLISYKLRDIVEHMNEYEFDCSNLVKELKTMVEPQVKASLKRADLPTHLSLVR